MNENSITAFIAKIEVEIILFYKKYFGDKYFR